MNRSTGLLQAYAALIQHVSGADCVSLYVPAAAEENTATLLHEGGTPVPELASRRAAQNLSSRRETCRPARPVAA